MKPNYRFFWLIILMGMSSCVSFQKFVIQVYKPAEITLPEHIHKVLLVSRNLRYLNDTLQNYYMDGHLLRKDNVTFNRDSLAVTNCLDSLAGRLAKQTRFTNIEAVRQDFMPLERVRDVAPAPAEWYQNLCDKSGADGLVVLDMFSCFYRRYNNPYPSAWVITSNIWSVYDAEAKKIIDRHPQTDTLIWDGTDETGRKIDFKVPDKRSAIALASGIIGSNYAKHLVPYWIGVNRQIMWSNDAELKRAAQLARNDDWSSASAIWAKWAAGSNSSKKLISLYNLALTSEMNGDYEKAMQYIRQAESEIKGKAFTAKSDAIRKYAAVLTKRLDELNKLKQQHAN